MSLIHEWLKPRLEAASGQDRILIRDPFRLLSDSDGFLHQFAKTHGFTVLVASTNLVFRDLYEKARQDEGGSRLLIVDRATPRQRSQGGRVAAVAPFYPDLLAETSPEARIEIGLRGFLQEWTHDPLWPARVEDPRFSRLITAHLKGVLVAHRNLRMAYPDRFTDRDLEVIIAYAAMGVPESAFRHQDAEEYWKIALLGPRAFEELESIAPTITRPIREKLRQAAPPFCHFATHDPELVLRAFYLGVILSQHVENWSPLLANIDPDLSPLAHLSSQALMDAADKLQNLDPKRVRIEIAQVENSLTAAHLEFLVFSQWNWHDPKRWADAFRRERSSGLLRSLILLLALDDSLGTNPAAGSHKELHQLLTDPVGAGLPAGELPDAAEGAIREAYLLALSVQALRRDLVLGNKNLGMLKPAQLSLAPFLKLWKEQRVSGLEYRVSLLERKVHHGRMLPRAEADLPPRCRAALESIRSRLGALETDVGSQLQSLDARFQDLVGRDYPGWVSGKGEITTTSSFLERILKPHWDPQREKAVLFIFDGMRIDIWQELVWPALEDRLEALVDQVGSSLLPSETHISRKAISAGTTPDGFDSHAAESTLLESALAQKFQWRGAVDTVAPDSAGTGETVRYRAGNLDVYILDLCDKELHKIGVKTLADRRQVPERPLVFIYQQLIKNIIDHEVMTIVRALTPGTKVFVTADHGFSRVGREKLWLDAEWLNAAEDCNYLNARLRLPLSELGVPGKVRANCMEFSMVELKMPDSESGFDKATHTALQKRFSGVIFPRVGYAFSRPQASFKPFAYTHGGVSLGEMLVPMVVAKVREADAGWLAVGEIDGPDELLEGQAGTFTLSLRSRKAGEDQEELKVQVEGGIEAEGGQTSVPRVVVFLEGDEVAPSFEITPDAALATAEERKAGTMGAAVVLTVGRREGGKWIRVVRRKRVTVRLNSERIARRIPPQLGAILGLTPKNMS